jgi:hypothetical protein
MFHLRNSEVTSVQRPDNLSQWPKSRLWLGLRGVPGTRKSRAWAARKDQCSIKRTEHRPPASGWFLRGPEDLWDLFVGLRPSYPSTKSYSYPYV